MISDSIKEYINQSSSTVSNLNTISSEIEAAVKTIAESFKAGGKILICGNGGSAADSQHIAAELVSRFRKERPSLPAVALTTNTSILTAIANDYDFSDVFSRQVESLGRPGDVLLAITTSGTSENILKALDTALSRQIKTIILTGSVVPEAVQKYDVSICVPSNVTSFVQEGHLVVYHLICDLLEKILF